MPLPYFVGADSSAGVICAFVYTVLICAFVLDMFFMHQYNIFKISILASIYRHSSIGHLVEYQTRVFVVVSHASILERGLLPRPW